jgi:hypothetical protein
MARIEGTATRPTLSLNAQETRDLTQLVTLLYEHAISERTSQISFDALLGDDDVWTLRQEVQKWANLLKITGRIIPRG